MSFVPINATLDVYKRILAVDYATNNVKVFLSNDLETPINTYGEGLFNFNVHGSAMPDIAYLKADLVEVVTESLKEADADNTEKEFTFELANDFINGSFLTITDGVETFSVSNDVFSGSDGGTGVIDEINGVVRVVFNAAPIAEITASYKHFGGDKIFVTDPFNHRVVVFKGNGEFITTFGKFGNGNGDLFMPSGIEVTSDDSEVHVVETNNHRISVFNASTYAFKSHYGLQAHLTTKGLYYPTDIVFDANGAFVTDTGHNRIVYFENDGGTWKEHTNYVTKQFSNDTYTSNRLAVLNIVNNSGRTGFHLSDVFHSNILTYDVTWTAGDDVAIKGITPGKVFLPRGLAVNDSNEILVCDTGNKRLQIVDLS